MSLWDEEAGYDRDDPKHPDYADVMIDRAERQLDEMKISGEWYRYVDWRAERFAAGLTGSALGLSEWRRQQAEDEAERPTRKDET